MTTKRAPRCFAGAFIIAAALVAPLPSSATIIPSSRMVDWSQVGIPGGVPVRATIYKTLAPLGQDQDDKPQIQDALNTCPPNQVVKLGGGTFVVKSSLTIPNAVVLRGSGPGATIIKAGIGDYIIRFEGPYWGWGGAELAHGSGASKGSTSITLDSMPTDFPLGAGMKIYLYQSNDTSEVFAGYNGGPQPYSKCQWVEITAVNSQAKTVTFKPPLYSDYGSSFNPKIRYNWGGNSSRNCTEFAGVEDLRVLNTNPNCAGNFFLNFTAYSWLKNIQSNDAGICHIFAQETYRCEVRDSTFEGVLAPLSSGRGYGLQMGTPNAPSPPFKTTAMLIENNIWKANRWHILYGYGTSGCVVGYNYFHSTAHESSYTQPFDIAAHSAFCIMNLIEGNVGFAVNLDDTNGNSSLHTLFRNYLRGKEAGRTTQINAIEIDAYNRKHNVVGNVLGNPGILADMATMTDPAGVAVYSDEAPAPSGYSNRFKVYMLGYSGSGAGTPYDTEVAATLLRHGNFDYVTGETHWDDAISDHDLPQSLYLSGKPRWWPAASPWPPIGPDKTPMTSAIPAELRFNGLLPNAPSPPSGLKIVTP